jgi:xanthine/CO dehydrogenase XdhC/CoxF family maturation factor
LSKEIQQIIEKLKTLEAGEKAILATVVDVAGSGYRRPGARMLIDQNGYGIGTVSGGCLEADVLERAKKVFATGAPTVITYDTTKDENSVFGLGMGCRGVVRILLETVSTDSFIFNYVSDLITDRMPFTIATRINSASGNVPAQRLYFDEYGAAASDFNETETAELLAKIRLAFIERQTGIENFSFGEVFIETVLPPVNLLLFGAGYDALPLVRFAKELGWRVSVVDHRPAFANAERLSEADEIFTKSLPDLDDDFFQDENSVAVIMTHNYDRDREILPRLLESKCLYIGALGPKKRTEKILAEAGENFSAAQLEKLHAPVGLDIGADTPEAIALSIVAEIQAVLKQRAGGFLRERRGSIYGRSQE